MTTRGEWWRRLKRLARTVVIYGVLIAVVATAISAWRMRDAASGTAPPLSGEDPWGDAVELAEHAGEPVLIYFWATWCPVCKVEAPTINALDRDHNVITVASWSESAAVGAYVKESGFRPPVLVDHGERWAEAYGIQAVPAFFIVDGDGAIRFTTSGYTPGIGLRLRLWWVGLTS
ncbi:MAG: redoxin domain-containing protein [Pseudomonadota bacterium]